MLALFLAAPSAKSTKTTEVVLSRYDEPLDWADALHTLATVTVYDKSRSPLPGSTPLPNVGRESHTYLSHIISRYESLAEWTVFSQAAEPSFGYKGHRSGGGHLAEGVSFSDYLTPRLSGAFFINTAAFNTADFSSSLRMSYTFDDPGLTSQAECPTRDGWSSWWDMGWFATYVRGKTSAQNGTSVIDFYNRYVRPEAEPVAAAVFSYPQGARFAVSAATIRRHPKAYYEALLETVSHSADPWAGYYLEWLWPVIFGRAACELPTTAIPPVTHRAAMADLERAYHAAVPADRRHLQTTPDPSPDPSPDASPVASPSPEPTSEPTPTPANPTPTPPAGESSPSPPSAPSPLPPSPPPVASSPPPSPPPVASSPPPPPSSPPPPPPLSPGEEMQHTVSFSVTVAAEADDVESLVEGMRLALADFLGLPPADIEAVVEADGRRRRASETVTVTFRIRVSGDVAVAEEVQTSLQELQGDSTAAEQALSLEAGALISMSSVELESRAVAQEAEEEPSKRELSTGVYAVIVLSSLLVTVGLMGAGVIVSRRRMAWKAVNEGDADKPEPSSTTAEDGKPEQRVLLGQQQV